MTESLFLDNLWQHGLTCAATFFMRGYSSFLWAADWFCTRGWGRRDGIFEKMVERLLAE